ncbi:hypothetical protein [Cereibacter changlensis]|uniref:hypothetical protein n=1 Tax=Cereibacter changlensis TaxID=402884 RepID=UPI004033B68D
MKGPRKDNPSSIFYWKDYENDEGLRISSLAAQGLWMRLLCVAAKAEPYGYILVNGADIGVTGAARLGSVTEDEAQILMAELERNGVFSRDRKGRAFSRRMVKDAAIRKKNANNGKKGGNPALGVSAGKERENEGSLNPPLNPPVKAPYPLPHSQEKKEEEEEEEYAQATSSLSDADRLLLDVTQAVGLRSGRIPTYWMPPAATLHVWRWVTDLGLDPARIVDAARQSRAGHPEPPGGPKALDGVMKRLAAELSAPPMQIPPAATGGRNERPIFDRTINQLADRLSDGSVQLDHSSRDPWKAGTR